MKQKDLAVIGGVILVSVVLSFIISSKVISTPSGRSRTVEVVSSISPIFPKPSTKYFNSESIDPTQIIQITTNANGTPFNGTQN